MDRRNDKICRMCLECSTNLRSLFAQSTELNLLSIAREIIRLDIAADDEFPKMICESCSTKLKKIEAYVKLFHESDRKLREMPIIKFEVADGITTSKNSQDKNLGSNRIADLLVDGNSKNASETTVCSSKNQNEPIGNRHELSVEKSANTARNVSNGIHKLHPTRRSQREHVKCKRLASPPDSSIGDAQSEEDVDLNIGDKDESIDDNPVETTRPDVETIMITEEVGYERQSLKRRTKLQQPATNSVKLKSRRAGDVPMLHDFKCYICSSESLGSRKALIEHLAIHVDKIPYTCGHCVMETVVLTRVRTLNTHIKMHEQPIKCDYCDRRYSNAAGKYYHTHTYHLGGGAPCIVSCKICGKQCGSEVALKQHMKYHTTSLKCSKCDKVFNHANKRRNHELTHSEKGGFECVVCKKILQTIESYDVHLKKHSQERSHQCTLCPKNFNTSFNLILHLKVHAKNYNYRPARSWVEHYTIVSRNPMQYKCNHCERYSTDKVNNMISHLQAHFKEHQCDRCKRLFATAKQLRAHYTTHTGEKAEMCQHCGKCFSTKNGLRIHLKSHSRDSVTARMYDDSEQPAAME